jgi:hypothetical protein
MAFDFEKALRRKIEQHTRLLERKNKRVKDGNGVLDRWEHPVLTAAHAPAVLALRSRPPKGTPSSSSGWG